MPSAYTTVLRVACTVCGSLRGHVEKRCEAGDGLVLHSGTCRKYMYDNNVCRFRECLAGGGTEMQLATVATDLNRI